MPTAPSAHVREDLRRDLWTWRHRLHTHPETGFTEHETSAFVAGIAAGTINAVVGSGPLVTFPVLLSVGLPPLTANVTNALGLVPGSFMGAYGYRRELSDLAAAGYSSSSPTPKGSTCNDDCSRPAR